MTADIEKLDARGYRKFGVTTGAIIIGLFGLVIPWLFNLNYPTWPWILGGGLGAWASCFMVSSCRSALLCACSDTTPCTASWIKR